MSQLHRITNHPIHIFDEEGNTSPSAFIPFCQFGRNISLMGAESELFSMPVCSSFRPKLFYDQLCYEVDVNRFQDVYNEEDLQLGLSILVDTNFNRQYSVNEKRMRTLPQENLGIK